MTDVDEDMGRFKIPNYQGLRPKTASSLHRAHGIEGREKSQISMTAAVKAEASITLLF